MDSKKRKSTDKNPAPQKPGRPKRVKPEPDVNGSQSKPGRPKRVKPEPDVKDSGSSNKKDESVVKTENTTERTDQKESVVNGGGGSGGGGGGAAEEKRPSLGIQFDQADQKNRQTALDELNSNILRLPTKSKLDSGINNAGLIMYVCIINYKRDRMNIGRRVVWSYDYDDVLQKCRKEFLDVAMLSSMYSIVLRADGISTGQVPDRIKAMLNSNEDNMSVKDAFDRIERLIGSDLFNKVIVESLMLRMPDTASTAFEFVVKVAMLGGMVH